jgi:hypothetical protein
MVCEDEFANFGLNDPGGSTAQFMEAFFESPSRVEELIILQHRTHLCPQGYANPAYIQIVPHNHDSEAWPSHDLREFWQRWLGVMSRLYNDNIPTVKFAVYTKVAGVGNS